MSIKSYVNSLPNGCCRKMLMTTIERLIECQEVQYIDPDDYPEEWDLPYDGDVVWAGSGESLLEDDE